jgi:hypothetical protein
MARNRYGWQKRAKELARKQKSDDKMRRRQGKDPETRAGITSTPAADPPAAETGEPQLPAEPSRSD